MVELHESEITQMEKEALSRINVPVDKFCYFVQMTDDHLNALENYFLREGYYFEVEALNRVEERKWFVMGIKNKDGSAFDVDIFKLEAGGGFFLAFHHHTIHDASLELISDLLVNQSKRKLFVEVF